MKKIFFTLFIAFIASCIPAKAQWYDYAWQPFTDDLQDVFFVNKDTGWVVGGCIYKTENAGVTWTMQYPHDSIFFNEVFFINKDIGWAVGDAWSFIIHTNDGGITWIQQFIPDNCISPHSCELFDVYFINHDTGWVTGVGDVGGTYHTTDGGNTWNLQSLYCFRSIFMLNDIIGWAGAGASVLHTNDGGTSWNVQYDQFPASVSKCIFVDTLHGWVSCNDYNYGAIFRTVDGGNTWEEIYSSNNRGMRSVFFIDENNGWAIGYDNTPLGDGGIIISSSDGGTTWETQDSYFNFWLNDIQFIDSVTGFTTGCEHFLKTDNGGFWGIIPVTNVQDKNNLLHNVKLNPNPFKSDLTITIKTTTTSIIKVDLYDISNRFISNIYDNVNSIGMNSIPLYLDFLHIGMYFLRVSEITKDSCIVSNFKIIKI